MTGSSVQPNRKSFWKTRLGTESLEVQNSCWDKSRTKVNQVPLGKSIVFIFVTSHWLKLQRNLLIYNYHNQTIFFLRVFQGLIDREKHRIEDFSLKDKV